MRKYGVDNFSVHLVEETTKDLLNSLETHYIKTTRPELNMTSGGEGGSTTHNKMWVTNGIINKYILKTDEIPEGYFRGRVCKFNDPEFQSEMGKRAHKNVDLSERGLAISKAKTGKTHVGVSHSQETKDKLSKVALNRKRIKCEHCNKLATAGMFSRWHGDNCKYANSDS